ncbi:MAG: sugar phosphate nucleotidyltransferase [Nautiliaceae bacterium]
MIDISVIPVAGFGTRFLPLTKSQPKEMIGIVDKPVIHYIVEEVAKSGIKTIVFVTGRYKRAIEDYFDASPELEYHLERQGKYKLLKIVKEVSSMIEPIYIRQKEAKGLGHAILMAKRVIRNRPFAVLLGDEIIEDEKPLLRTLIDKFETYQASILSVYKVPWEKVSNYGVVSGKVLEEDKNLIFNRRASRKTSYK